MAQISIGEGSLKPTRQTGAAGGLLFQSGAATRGESVAARKAVTFGDIVEQVDGRPPASPVFSWRASTRADRDLLGSRLTE
jgi:hypothetical protein